MLQAERDEVLRLRDEGRADHVVLRVVLSALDLEETMLDRLDDQESRLAESEMLPVDTIEAPCEHLAGDRLVPWSRARPRAARSACATARRGCTCGCASSAGTSAAATPRSSSTPSAHFRESEHPVMRSMEPGEAWRWCFVDEVVG